MSHEHPLLLRARRDLERVELQRAKLEAMLKLIDQEAQRLRHFIEQYEVYVGEQDKQASSPRYRMSTREVTDIAVSIIEQAESALSIQEILERLDLRGIEVGGENKSANLAAYLSKDNRVRHERGYGWMLSSKALFPEESISQSHKSAQKKTDFSWRPQSSNRPSAGLVAESSVRVPTSELDDEIPF